MLLARILTWLIEQSSGFSVTISANHDTKEVRQQHPLRTNVFFFFTSTTTAYIKRKKEKKERSLLRLCTELQLVEVVKCQFAAWGVCVRSDHSIGWLGGCWPIVTANRYAMSVVTRGVSLGEGQVCSAGDGR